MFSTKPRIDFNILLITRKIKQSESAIKRQIYFTVQLQELLLLYSCRVCFQTLHLHKTWISTRNGISEKFPHFTLSTVECFLGYFRFISNDKAFLNRLTTRARGYAYAYKGPQFQDRETKANSVIHIYPYLHPRNLESFWLLSQTNQHDHACILK